uniref:AT-hook motif nuclear-localized protein 16-like n=1 Tax=Tanacetum cinerariifolium TaxID=118510 RepID=A0A699KVV2_TANCI|nr:AT-hook motif nuclear-localized protein 16-like [Tanacetum cinerariifolium]
MAGSADLSAITSRTGEHIVRRPRGRPAGSKNKPKPPIIITRDSANTLRAHAMEDLWLPSTADLRFYRWLVRFEILSLVGSVSSPPAPPGVDGLAIYLVGPQGQDVGGSIAGPLMASGPVVITAATFLNATFDRLPIDKEEAVVAPTHDQHHHCVVGVPDIYGAPQNLFSNATVPPDFYTWSTARPLSKA